MQQKPLRLTIAVSFFVSALCAGSPIFGQEANSPESAGSAADNSGNALIQEARKKVVAFQSVRAELREKVAIGARRFAASGVYIQGQGNQIRIDLRLAQKKSTAKKPKSDPAKAKDATTKKKDNGRSTLPPGIIKVCDGKLLWTEFRVGRNRSVQRCDVAEVNKAVAGTPQANMWLADLGLGGVQAMLTSLDRNMEFDAPKSEAIDGTDYLMVQGSWNAVRRQAILGSADGGDKPLPGYIPDFARVYFHKDSLFPRTIMYLKQHPQEKHRARPMVTLDFVNIAVDVPLDKDAFVYTPPAGTQQQDTTDSTIKQIQGMSKAGKTP